MEDSGNNTLFDAFESLCIKQRQMPRDVLLTLLVTDASITINWIHLLTRHMKIVAHVVPRSSGDKEVETIFAYMHRSTAVRKGIATLVASSVIQDAERRHITPLEIHHIKRLLSQINVVLLDVEAYIWKYKLTRDKRLLLDILLKGYSPIVDDLHSLNSFVCSIRANCKK